MTRALSRYANITSLVSIAVVTAVLGSRYVSEPNVDVEPASLSDSGSHPVPGTNLALPGVDFTQAETTVVVALSTQCLIGNMNVQLYGELAAANQRVVQVVAALPEPPSEARPFLENLNLSDLRTSQVSFAETGIHLTPTLVVVDRDGRVVESYEGKLPDEQVSTLRRRFGLLFTPDERPTPVTAAVQGVTTMSVNEALAADIPVVDIRPRTVRERIESAGPLRIPIDELPVRARHELPDTGPIVVVCGECQECTTGLDEARLQSLCLRGFRHLRSLGFRDVRLGH